MGAAKERVQKCRSYVRAVEEEEKFGGLGGCVVEGLFDSVGRRVWVLRGRGGEKAIEKGRPTGPNEYELLERGHQRYSLVL